MDLLSNNTKNQNLAIRENVDGSIRIAGWYYCRSNILICEIRLNLKSGFKEGPAYGPDAESETRYLGARHLGADIRAQRHLGAKCVAAHFLLFSKNFIKNIFTKILYLQPCW